jgi:hypothetical protein
MSSGPGSSSANAVVAKAIATARQTAPRVNERLILITLSPGYRKNGSHLTGKKQSGAPKNTTRGPAPNPMAQSVGLNVA